MRHAALFFLLIVLPAAAEKPLVCPEGNLLREWRLKPVDGATEAYDVVRDSTTWSALWKNLTGEDSAPAVDFTHEMVIAVLPAETLEIGWVRISRVATPGQSRLWVGLCACPAKRQWQVAVTGRSDLEVEFWTKDDALTTTPGEEPAAGGHPVNASKVHGAAGVWRKKLPALDEASRKEAEAYLKNLGSDDPGEREAATRGLLRLGPSVREVIDDAFRDDAEVEVRIAQLQGLLPTFDPSGPPVTREHALWLAREHLVATYPDQFSDSPQMRWEDVGARYLAGPAWTLTLKYL